MSQSAIVPEVEGTLSDTLIINKIKLLRKNQESLEKFENIAVNFIDVGSIPINRENTDQGKETEDKETEDKETEDKAGIGNTNKESTDSESMEENKWISTSYFNEQVLQQQKVTTLQHEKSSSSGGSISMKTKGSFNLESKTSFAALPSLQPIDEEKTETFCAYHNLKLSSSHNFELLENSTGKSFLFK